MGGTAIDLRAALDGIDVVVDPDILESYRRDQAAPGLLEAGVPAALVRPRTTAEVQAAVRAAPAPGSAAAPTPSTAAWSCRWNG